MNTDNFSKYIKKHIRKLPKGTYLRDKTDIRKDLYDKYDDIVSDINSIIKDISILIGNFDPLSLLTKCYIDEVTNSIMIQTESDLSKAAIISTRIKEYVHAILISRKYNQKKDIFSYSIYSELLNKYVILHNLILVDFAFSSSIRMSEYFDNNAIIEDLCFKQIEHLYNVRNNRYQIHYEIFLRTMFSSFDDFFKRIYNITSDDFIIGCINIYNSLMIGVPTFLFQEIPNINKINIPKKNDDNQQHSEILYNSKNYEISSSIFYQELIKYFDVQLITKWPSDFIKDLSWKLGEYKEYFTDANFPAWPILQSPLKLKPFIFISDRFYCFDFVNLMDNIYGSIKYLFSKTDPKHKTQCKNIQKEITETHSIELITSILPHSKSYIGSFYQSPPSKSRKQNWCEIDGLVEYDDVLIMIEVKSGSFTYLPPSSDFAAHLNSLRDLIVKPTEQINRFYEHLINYNYVDIYSSIKGNIMKRVNFHDYRAIYFICTTLECIPHITTDVKKISKIFPQLNRLPIMFVSIDDLRIYSDIFDQPLQFLHFLEQRKKIFNEQKFISFDEMDHLCMYLKYNCYSMVYSDLPKHTFIHQIDLHDELDLYYSALMSEPENAKKPKQIMPDLFKEILSILNNKTTKGKTLVASSLLDLDYKSRYKLENVIRTSLISQEELGRTTPYVLTTNVNFYIQFSTPKIIRLEKWELEEKLFEQLILAKNETSIAIDLFFDEKYQLIDVDYLIQMRNQIPIHRYKEFEKRANAIASKRIEKHLMNIAKRKIGRNEPCPCGSGKKYKKCHGR